MSLERGQAALHQDQTEEEQTESQDHVADVAGPPPLGKETEAHAHGDGR